MTSKRILCWTTLGLILSFPALAHDTWLLARSTAVAPGATVSLDLTSGMAFPANETAIKPDRVARAAVRLAGDTTDLKDRRSAAKSLQLTARLPKPGIAALWVELAPKSIDLKPDQVKEYLDEIGASQAVRRAWREMPEPRRWRELYSKHAKTYVRVGEPAGDHSWAEPVGMALEIVPEKDPTALRPGDELPVRLLRDGAPLASFAVGLVHQGDAHGVLKTTDDQGRATFPIGQAGRWLLRATEVRRSTKPEADWESDFTTMTFEVRRPLPVR
jgi:uncharacterized GH25 family protein